MSLRPEWTRVNRGAQGLEALLWSVNSQAVVRQAHEDRRLGSEHELSAFGRAAFSVMKRSPKGLGESVLALRDQDVGQN